MMEFIATVNPVLAEVGLRGEHDFCGMPYVWRATRAFDEKLVSLVFGKIVEP